jgi:hypothetical protein
MTDMNERNNGRQLKSWLKRFPLLVKLKRELWSLFDPERGTTRLNVVQAFPLYLPYSAGNYSDRAQLTLKTINQIFPSLCLFVQHIQNKKLIVENIEELSLNFHSIASAERLKQLFDSYGSDKASRHNYHHLYGAILRDPKKVGSIFEIGLGTNNKDIVSNMGLCGRPGASLRAFRDYCPNALVYGADLDKRVLFEEERIKTFFVDQTMPATFGDLLTKLPKKFDLVIDDGLHSPDANIASLEFGLKIVNKNGWIVIEDIGHAAISFWQIVSAVLPNNYEPHIFSAAGAIVFAVKRLR